MNQYAQIEPDEVELPITEPVVPAVEVEDDEIELPPTSDKDDDDEYEDDDEEEELKS